MGESRPAADSRRDDFVARHVGTTADDERHMLATVGYADLDSFIADVVPPAVRSAVALKVPAAVDEIDVLGELEAIAGRNVVRTSLIGTGYYDTITPPVILRNVIENPAWYTAYTPYQPEISQGRLEALLNFQTMVTELTGMDLANASLLDEATAVAEAIVLARRSTKHPSTTVAVHEDVHPQILAVVNTRCAPVGIVVHTCPLAELAAVDAFCIVVAQPGSSGAVAPSDELRTLVTSARAAGGVSVCITDPLASTLLVPAGQLGFDIAVGSAQRFGVPMGFGGPHAAYIATRESFARALPGRLVGVSTDTAGRPALRLALQTREQHIRREKATSNICTAQALLANVAGFYAVWHGPEGLRRIARRVAGLTAAFTSVARAAGLEVANSTAFDTVTVRGIDAEDVLRRALADDLLLRRVNERTVGLSFDETSGPDTVVAVCRAFGATTDPAAIDALAASILIPDADLRTDDFLTQSVFHRHRSETEMLRYLRRLADKDLALDRTMIPLGSCTMKLNATTEMIPVTWPSFARVHPHAPDDDVAGYRMLIDELSRFLCDVTGYDAVSLQPNAGSQGEFAGLLAIRAYHDSRGDTARTVCLIPQSAHGTNAASAVMAGMEVVVVKCDDRGNVDVDDVKRLCADVGHRLAALMVTYPSTHGVFESAIADVCGIVHDNGGQVYVDGANLNALVGLVRPGHFGADVSHLNLHKTFCIPHGGGGPGVGPVAVRAHLAPFLPEDPRTGGAARRAISAANNGSASILPISWTYIRLMGGDGLVLATMRAILAANYVARRLADHFPTLYTGASGLVAHECILDLRPLTKTTGVTVEDVAKRLMDYGFHAPTISFPVAGTLMVEPTESESLRELDRFCTAMIAIRSEIDAIERGTVAIDDSPLRHAPHTVEDVVGPWDRAYDRNDALFPLPELRSRGYYPPVSRIDAAHGDRNLVCSCEPLEAFASSRYR
jgi:glycine dehydrogenase